MQCLYSTCYHWCTLTSFGHWPGLLLAQIHHPHSPRQHRFIMNMIPYGSHISKGDLQCMPSYDACRQMRALQLHSLCLLIAQRHSNLQVPVFCDESEYEHKHSGKEVPSSLINLLQACLRSTRLLAAHGQSLQPSSNRNGTVGQLLDYSLHPGTPTPDNAKCCQLPDSDCQKPSLFVASTTGETGHSIKT